MCICPWRCAWHTSILFASLYLETPLFLYCAWHDVTEWVLFPVSWVFIEHCGPTSWLGLPQWRWRATCCFRQALICCSLVWDRFHAVPCPLPMSLLAPFGGGSPGWVWIYAKRRECELSVLKSSHTACQQPSVSPSRAENSSFSDWSSKMSLYSLVKGCVWTLSSGALLVAHWGSRYLKALCPRNIKATSNLH